MRLDPAMAPGLSQWGAVRTQKPKLAGMAPPHNTVDTMRFSGVRKSAPVSGLIDFDPDKQTFRLAGRNMEYFLQIRPDGELANLYWGKPVGKIEPSLLPFNFTRPNSWQQPLDMLPREYPDTGRGDNRIPAVRVQSPDGQSVSQFQYVTHRILPGKPDLPGLPSIYADAADRAQTLVVTMRDDAAKLELDLSYTVFADYNVIIRSARITNHGDLPVDIRKLASISADFNPGDYRLLKLSGASIRERQEETVDLKPGIFTVSSNLGASGHVHNPFVALLEKNTTEEAGNAYGFSLVYSGSFSAEAEQNRLRYTRLVMGLNPDTFQWKLPQGGSFQTPEAIGVYSAEGTQGLTRQMHQLFRNNLIRGNWKDKPRPVLLNTWEAIGPNVSHEKVIEMARQAKDLGVDLIVLDDGWFGQKYPRTGVDALGDWVDNPAKLPKGLGGLAKEINELGLMFGIWMEPEMVSPKSELYEKHPDWVIHQPNRFRSPVKNQYILDLGRPDVQDYIIEAVSRVLDSGNIQYLKWDMNRTMTEIGSAGLPPDRQAETQHRYMLGLYRVLDVLTKKYPDVLFEGCAGGGGRFDPGMLAFFPQIWTSDNTDAMSRLNIQAGTARVYPAMTMGSHVSPVPNGQVGRMTNLKTRFHVAMSGNLGLELDPAELNPDEKKFAREQIAFYKQVRHIVQDGSYHLLSSPFESNWPAWMFADEKGKEALVFAFQKMAEPNMPVPSVRLKGLKPDALYRVNDNPAPVTGAFLMNVGITPRFTSDFDSNLFYLRRVR